MQFTEEILKTLYGRANEFAIAKYGTYPDKLILEEDGTITARTETYHCGDYDYDDNIITADDLTADLDAIAEERRQMLERQRQAEEIRRREEQERRERMQKEQRRQEYLKLKKEFES